MFTISHSPEGAFRLEVHAPVSKLNRRDARRLQSVLLGLAEKAEEATREDSSSESHPVPLGSRSLSATREAS